MESFLEELDGAENEDDFLNRPINYSAAQLLENKSITHLRKIKNSQKNSHEEASK